MWTAVLGDILFPSLRTTSKVYILLGDEFTKYLINIIGDTLKHLADYFGFVSMSVIRYYNW